MGQLMKFSANLGFLYTHLPLPGAIRAARAGGFDALECHFPYETAPVEMRQALSETGLRMLVLNTWPGERCAGDFGLAALPGRRDELAQKLLVPLTTRVRQVSRRYILWRGGPTAIQPPRIAFATT